MCPTLMLLHIRDWYDMFLFILGDRFYILFSGDTVRLSLSLSLSGEKSFYVKK